MLTPSGFDQFLDAERRRRQAAMILAATARTTQPTPQVGLLSPVSSPMPVPARGRGMLSRPLGPAIPQGFVPRPTPPPAPAPAPPVVGGIGDFFSGLGSGASQVGQGIGNAAQGIGNAAQSLGQGAVGAAQGFAGGVEDYARSIGEAVINTFEPPNVPRPFVVGPSGVAPTAPAIPQAPFPVLATQAGFNALGAALEPVGRAFQWGSDRTKDGMGEAFFQISVKLRENGMAGEDENEIIAAYQEGGPRAAWEANVGDLLDDAPGWVAWPFLAAAEIGTDPANVAGGVVVRTGARLAAWGDDALRRIQPVIRMVGALDGGAPDVAQRAAREIVEQGARAHGDETVRIAQEVLDAATTPSPAMGTIIGGRAVPGVRPIAPDVARRASAILDRRIRQVDRAARMAVATGRVAQVPDRILANIADRLKEPAIRAMLARNRVTRGAVELTEESGQRRFGQDISQGLTGVGLAASRGTDTAAEAATEITNLVGTAPERFAGAADDVLNRLRAIGFRVEGDRLVGELTRDVKNQQRRFLIETLPTTAAATGKTVYKTFLFVEDAAGAGWRYLRDFTGDVGRAVDSAVAQIDGFQNGTRKLPVRLNTSRDEVLRTAGGAAPAAPTTGPAATAAREAGGAVADAGEETFTFGNEIVSVDDAVDEADEVASVIGTDLIKVDNVRASGKRVASIAPLDTQGAGRGVVGWLLRADDGTALTGVSARDYGGDVDAARAAAEEMRLLINGEQPAAQPRVPEIVGAVGEPGENAVSRFVGAMTGTIREQVERQAKVLNGPQRVATATVNGVQYVIDRSQYGNSFVIHRTNPGAKVKRSGGRLMSSGEPLDLVVTADRFGRRLETLDSAIAALDRYVASDDVAARVLPVLRRRLDAMGLRHVDLELRQEIGGNLGEHYPGRGLIRLAVDVAAEEAGETAWDDALAGTLDHEAVHALIDMRVVAEREVDAVVSVARRIPYERGGGTIEEGVRARWEGSYGFLDAATRDRAMKEEMVAEVFRAWRRNPEWFDQQTASLMERVQAVLRAALDAAREIMGQNVENTRRDIDTARGFLEGAASGDIAARGRGNVPAGDTVFRSALATGYRTADPAATAVRGSDEAAEGAPTVRLRENPLDEFRVGGSIEVPEWQTALALSPTQIEELSRTFAKDGPNKGRAYGEVFLETLRDTAQMLADIEDTGTLADEAIPADIKSSKSLSARIQSLLTDGMPENPEQARLLRAELAAHRVEAMIEDDLGWTEARKARSAFRKAIGPLGNLIVDQAKLVPAMAREAMLYNVATGAAYIGTNILSGVAQALMMRDWRSVVRSLTPRMIGETWQEVKGDTSLVSELDEVALKLGIPAPATIAKPRGKDDLARLASETRWNEFFRFLGPGRKLTAPIASQTIKELAIVADNVFRKGMYLTAMEKALPQTRERFLSEFPQFADAIRAAIPEGDFFDAEGLRRRLLANGMEGPAASDVARRWAAHAQAMADDSARRVEEAYFSLDQLNLDKALGTLFTFHYWSMRASLFYARHMIRDPRLFRAYQAAAQHLEEEAENGDYPPRFKNFLKVWNTPLGFAIFMNPVALFQTWVTFRDDPGNTPEDRSWIERLMTDVPPFNFLFLNPVIDAALNLGGAYGETFAPDPLATGSIRSAVGAAMNFVNANTGVLGGEMLGTPYQDFWKNAREGISGAFSNFLPAIRQVQAVEGNAFDVDKLHWRILELSKEQGGTPDEIYARATSAMWNPSDPLYAEAYQDVSEVNLMIAGLRAVAPFRFRASQTERVASQEAVRAWREQMDANPSLDPTQIPSETKAGQTDLAVARAGSPAASQVVLADAALDGVVAAFPEMRRANERWAQALDQAKAQGYPDSIANQFADMVVIREGLYPALVAYREARGQFEEILPEFGRAKEWGRQVRSEYGDDLAGYRATVSRNNPAAAEYYERVERLYADDPEALDAATLSMNAYMAIHGIRASIFDPAEGTGLSTGSAPYNALPAGGGGPGQGDPVGSFMQTLAQYEAESRAFGQVASMIGLPYADVNAIANPFMRQAAGNRLARYGLTPPSMPSGVADYQRWLASQAPGSAVDPLTYLGWRSQMEATAPMQVLAGRPSSADEAIQNYLMLREFVDVPAPMFAPLDAPPAGVAAGAALLGPNPYLPTAPGPGLTPWVGS